jgi:FSR family fosmidomycin resistance protein-like MFS transporter
MQNHKKVEIANQEKIHLTILIALTLAHLINDAVQSLIFGVYPILKNNYNLSFTQIGLITIAFQFTASLLQPAIGYYTDKKPKPYLLVVGMGLSFLGLLLLASAKYFLLILIAASLVGCGSSIFHPESSRIARMASGGKHGFAQSMFQVGGNVGTALGPIIAALIILPRGQQSIFWLSIIALFGMIILSNISKWYKEAHLKSKLAPKAEIIYHNLSSKKIITTIAILLLLIFSKFFYIESIKSYYTFYLIDKFHISIASSQIHLAIFLVAFATGGLAGGIIGDIVGRKIVIWVSILGVLPFTLLLPYANLFFTEILSVIIGLIMASSFSAIVVYGQELLPKKIGTISGLFFGFGFGMAGVSAGVLGKIADLTNITFVYQLCAFIPAIGIFTYFLPNIKTRKSSV